MAVRVRILTFHHVINFGAVLQAYALCKAVNELGGEARVVDYRPESVVGNYRRWGRRPTSIVRSIVRKRRFAHFRHNHLPRTNRVYAHPSELLASPPEADVYVCGSDQIWNLIILHGQLDAGYFLGFGPPTVRRVAYAPSFGDGVFPEALRDEAARLLGRIDALSAREESGRVLIRELTGREAPVVLDPSLLIDDYSEALVDPQNAPERYIAVYALEYSDILLDFVRCVKNTLGLPVVNIGSHPLRDAEFNHPSLGPSEWLGWMKRASFICTNSFHGTAFSIVFRRDFASIPLQCRPALNTRISGLLEQLSLGCRFVANTSSRKNLEARLGQIDYARVEPLMLSAVSRSRDFLAEALMGRNLRPCGTPAPDNGSPASTDNLG